MTENVIVDVSVLINASPSKVWETLINPNYIKQYMFGTNTITTWKKGASIIWKGIWEGKTYEDKGVVLDIIPEKLLKYTYWSSISGLEDKPENYKTITCTLIKEENNTILKISQDNNTEASKKHSEENWKTVGNKIKEIAESL